MNNFEQKAKDLVVVFGKDTAIKVVDVIITELQHNWNQDRIDFYLDVRSYIYKSY